MTAAGWDAFLGDLGTAGWLVAAVGVVLAAAATAIIQPVGIERPLGAAWRRLRGEPHHVGARIARAAVLLAVGAVLVAGPEAAPRFRGLGSPVFYVLYKGVEAILRLIGGPALGPRPLRALPPAVRGGRRGRRGDPLSWRRWAPGSSLPAAPMRRHRRRSTHATARPLCDRPWTDRARRQRTTRCRPARPGWFAAPRGPSRPVEAGIRGLLFDTHYADRLARGHAHRPRAARGPRGDAKEADSDQSGEAPERLVGRIGGASEGSGPCTCATRCASSARRA